MADHASRAGTQSKIRLYTYAMSPYASKVHCFLLYKKLDFECFYINPLRVRQDLPVGKQIPVVTVGTESRADSTPIGMWLDELFPDHPRLLPHEGVEREKLLSLDEWMTKYVIPRTFRFYPGEGLNRILNGWKLSYVMANTAEGGLPFLMRAAWPLFIKRVPFVRRLLASADDGRPIAEAKRTMYKEFIDRLEGGPFLGGRDTPSLPDLSAYPQFALFYSVGFRGGDDILQEPELMAWMRRMRLHVSGLPPLLPANVRQRDLP